MVELWKELEGHVGTYLVSNTGKVESKARLGARNYFVVGKPKAQQFNSSGYLRVQLRLKDDLKAKGYFVHRLVAMTIFILCLLRV